MQLRVEPSAQSKQSYSIVIMDKTDEEILENDPELAQLFTDDEDEDDTSTTFNFGRSRDSRRSQSAKLG